MSFSQDIKDSIISNYSTPISDPIGTYGSIPFSESCPSEEVKKWARVAYGLAIICCVIGAVINILTILTVYKLREFIQQTIVPLILYNCIPDLMLSIIWLPFRAAKFLALSRCKKGVQCELKWPLGEQFSTMHVKYFMSFPL